MKKILVTGAGGFIGSHLTEELVRQGYNVKAFIHYNSFNLNGWLDYCKNDIKESIEIFRGDIRDAYGVKNAMYGSEIVYHLAALIGIPYSYHSPETYIDTNIKGTLNVLQAARELNVNKIIHTSTSEADRSISVCKNFFLIFVFFFTFYVRNLKFLCLYK